MGLSAEDLRDLSHELSALARALADWGSAHPITDTKEQSRLDGFISDLVEASNTLEDAAVQTALANVAVAATDLEFAAQKAQDALKVIQDVQEVLAIAGAAVGVGTALIAPIPSAAAIASAVDGLVQALSTKGPSNGVD